MRGLLQIWTGLLLCLPLHAANWIVLRTPGLELYTDAAEKPTRAALERLSNIRRLLPENRVEPTRLRIVMFSSMRDYRAIAPTESSPGLYQSGVERDYIVMGPDAQLSRVAVHEYVHFALNSHETKRPAWIEEGLAEFFSNAQFTGASAKLGVPIPEHLQLLERREWFTPEQVEKGVEDPLFYAQAWALVHMFWHQPVFPEHLSVEDFEDVRRYIKNLKADTVPAPPSISAPKVTLEPVSALDVLLVRGDLAWRTQHLDLAKGFFEQAVREFPNSSAAMVGLGAMEAATGDEAGARASLKRAIEINDRDAGAWFQVGLLEHDDAALVRAAELNPNLGEAHLLLGVHATDDGDLTGALAHLELAVRLMPLKSYAWYSLGFAYTRAGKVEEARVALQKALHTASTPEQKAMAETLLGSLN